MLHALQGRGILGVALGGRDAADRSTEVILERSTSLLGTGSRGDINASGTGPGPEAAGAGGAGAQRSQHNMGNSRCMGVIAGGGAGNNPSGLFSCR